MTDHDRWRDDLAAYMLGALEPEEVAEFERHAEDCDPCRAEMVWLTPAVDALPEAVERLELPPALRGRILNEVEADARAAGVSTVAAEDGLLARTKVWLRELGSGPMGLRPVVGFAAAVLVVAAVAGFAIGGGIGGGSSSENSSTYAAGKAPGVTAKVVRTGDSGTVTLAAVSKLPEDRILEAWVRRDGEVEPVPALFVPNREGVASITIEDMQGVDRVMVTTEPEGGSPAPTSAPIVEVPIPKT